VVQEVPDSNPGGPTKFFNKLGRFYNPRLLAAVVKSVAAITGGNYHQGSTVPNEWDPWNGYPRGRGHPRFAIRQIHKPIGLGVG